VTLSVPVFRDPLVADSAQIGTAIAAMPRQKE